MATVVLRNGDSPLWREGTQVSFRIFADKQKLGHTNTGRLFPANCGYEDYFYHTECLKTVLESPEKYAKQIDMALEICVQLDDEKRIRDSKNKKANEMLTRIKELFQ